MKKKALPAKPAKKEIKLRSVKPKLRAEPLWNLERDGVTFSLLQRFYVCRHRFWIRTVLGLRPDEGFKHSMEYGSMFHAGLEAFAHSDGNSLITRIDYAKKGIKAYGTKLKSQFPDDEGKIIFWRNLAEAQFEVYANHWKKEDLTRDYTAQEATFCVPTVLPSGRTVKVRGKYDELFIQKKDVLQENKCKGEVDEVGITSALHTDMQTGTYLHSLDGSDLIDGRTCLDVLYNVILRPLGGKYPMRQKVSETEKQFQQRAIDDIHANPDKYFHRWKVSLSKTDLQNFRNRILFPMLEQLCDWWESIKTDPMNPWMTDGWERLEGNSFKPIRVHNRHHYLRPFGIYDPQLNQGRGDFHEFIMSDGQIARGLKTLDTVFPELEDPSLAALKG